MNTAFNSGLIAAIGKNGVIGNSKNKSGLPWGRLQKDLAFFEKKTTNCLLIMGRITADTLIRLNVFPLRNRINVIITRDKKWEERTRALLREKDIHIDFLVVHSFEDAVAKAEELQMDTWYIGGGQVYKEALEKATLNTICITSVHGTFEGDVFFPKLDILEKYEISESFTQEKNEKHAESFETITYRLKKNAA